MRKRPRWQGSVSRNSQSSGHQDRGAAGGAVRWDDRGQRLTIRRSQMKNEKCGCTNWVNGIRNSEFEFWNLDLYFGAETEEIFLIGIGIEIGHNYIYI